MKDQTRASIAEREDILTRLKDCLVSNLNVRFRPEEIDPDVPLFVSGLGLDSVDALEVVITVEREFGVEIPDGDVPNIRTINCIADFVLANRPRNET